MDFHLRLGRRVAMALAAGLAITGALGLAAVRADIQSDDDAANPTNTPNDDAWSEIDQFHNRMDQLFGQTFDQAGRSAFSVPNIDLRDEKDHYVVVIDVPGADQGKLNVNIEGNVLTISGQRDDSSAKGARVLRNERSESRFERVLTLPGPVNSEAMKSTYTNGVLTITLPKAPGKTAIAQASPNPAHAPSAAANPWPGFFPDMGMSSQDAIDQIEQFHNRMDQLFSQTFSQSDLGGFFKGGMGMVPTLDLRDENDHYEVRMDMPGADKTSLKVKVEGRSLSVSGQRAMTSDGANAGKVIRQERGTAQFERSMTLPGPVKAGAVDAHYDNGVLTIRLPKDEAATTPTDVPVR